MRLLAIILITILFSCKASEKETLVGVQGAKDKIKTTNKIDFTVIKEGDNSKYKKAQNITITTQKEMDLAWGNMFGKYTKMPPIPMVNFETKQLLIIAMGEQVNGGYATKVASIIETPENVAITIEDSKPGKSCTTTSALTYPFQLIEMPKTSKELKFTRVSKINECK